MNSFPNRNINKGQNFNLWSLEEKKKFSYFFQSWLQENYWNNVRKINLMLTKNKYLEIIVFACKNELLGTRGFLPIGNVFLAPISIMFIKQKEISNIFSIRFLIKAWQLLQGLERAIKYERPTNCSTQRYLLPNHQTN